ncbi:ketosteroid isomerase-like protein [Ulvibacter sp. MAR_2010_11]|uniref:YybH family protein n=1 Tax=Ulvibacter sp. MAR_2010_11 TaxID=1250229 RepID=UPI000C2BCE71|nr:DUF4440 domain-containing protein [Ulvibacter sp. MAR_2010_11]PKA84405.1 ketosteroid isomerase-like protein [Ulvibacter sp. MAR_2010_11]
MKKIAQFFVLILVFACAQEKPDVEKEGQELMQLSREWSDVAATGDVDKTVSYWSDDAVFIASGQPTLRGKENLRAMVEDMSKIPGFKISWEPESVSVSESGDMAYLIENNSVTVNDTLGNPVTTTNRVVTIWKKDSLGNWKNVLEASAADPK